MKKDKFFGYPLGEHGEHKKEDELFEYPLGDDLFFPYYTENMRFDPNGMFTGAPDLDVDLPIQDEDDL